MLIGFFSFPYLLTVLVFARHPLCPQKPYFAALFTRALAFPRVALLKCDDSWFLLTFERRLFFVFWHLDPLQFTHTRNRKILDSLQPAGIMAVPRRRIFCTCLFRQCYYSATEFLHSFVQGITGALYAYIKVQIRKIWRVKWARLARYGAV